MNKTSEYQTNIIEAIQAVAQNEVANAGYDRTIEAKIVSCVDESLGKYRVQYQDSSFFAYSLQNDYIYNPGVMVYVLIAGNDMTRDKTILGLVDKSIDNYVIPEQKEEAYETIGNNCIDGGGAFEFCSYSGSQELIVYDKEKHINLIGLNLDDVENYIKGSNFMNCGGTFRTALPIEQQFRGNYGVVFEAAFVDNATQETTLKQYEVGINSILGNPYKLTRETKQRNSFEIDGNNFQYINRIFLYINNFPNTRAGEPMDIFIKDLELYGTITLDESASQNIGLTFITPKGTYFTDKDTDEDTRTIQAQVKIKGKNIDPTSRNLEYYWFVENMHITGYSDKYCVYGGEGWSCLNDYTIIQDTGGEPVVE